MIGIHGANSDDGDPLIVELCIHARLYSMMVNSPTIVMRVHGGIIGGQRDVMAMPSCRS